MDARRASGTAANRQKAALLEPEPAQFTRRPQCGTRRAAAVGDSITTDGASVVRKWEKQAGWEAGDGETEKAAVGDMAGERETAAVSENQSGAKQRYDNKTVMGSW